MDVSKIRIYIHVGYIIEGLLPVLEYFSEMASKLSKKRLEMRNQFALYHINQLKDYKFKMVDSISAYGSWQDQMKYANKEKKADMLKRSAKIKELADTVPEHSEGIIVSYFVLQTTIDNQNPFIGICIECDQGTFYTVLYDNGKNSLIKCIRLMKENLTSFVKIEKPIEVRLRKYIMSELI